jgi:hypothetical protein
VSLVIREEDVKYLSSLLSTGESNEKEAINNQADS